MMRNRVFPALVLALAGAIFYFAALNVAYAQQKVGIASGQKSGTQWPMAQDIVKACTTDDVVISNVISDGGLDNLQKVYGDRNSQYGIVPIDTLVYQKGLDPKMMERIQVVFPFYSAEMHLIVKENSPIKSLADLAGKRVVEGPEGSGTWVSVQLIKALSGLTWQGSNYSQTQGYDKVLKGEVDAEFIVAGKPITMLESASGVKLVPIAHPKLDEFAYYTKTMIPTKTYNFQKTSVSTYKVDTALVTFAYKNQFQKEIGSLVSCVAKAMPKLQAEGSPKWRDVDVTDVDRIKWPVHPAAASAIKAALKNAR